MRYCPSTACPYRRRTRRPVEYQDHVKTCADCGAALVDDFAVARDGIAPENPAVEPRGYREPAILAAVAEEEEARARAARVDVITGVCFLALSVLLMVATVRHTSEGYAFTVALLPLGYGLVRLLRGLGRK
jgi:hypothetical protein